MKWFRDLLNGVGDREEWIMTKGARMAAMLMLILAVIFGVRILFQLGIF